MKDSSKSLSNNLGINKNNFLRRTTVTGGGAFLGAAFRSMRTGGGRESQTRKIEFY